MVTTTSAALTASATEAAFEQPAPAALSSAAAERSKAMTSRPAFAWLAAMPPPMLPRPMNATRRLTDTRHHPAAVARFRDPLTLGRMFSGGRIVDPPLRVHDGGPPKP